MYYITGDIHGDITRIEHFCKKLEDESLIKETTLIILGDCGFNYYLNKTDAKLKKRANELGLTLFCIKGNHELHADQISSYKEKIWNQGIVFYEEEYPNLLFAKDGEIYDIGGKKTLVIGGAYSVDKHHRLDRGLAWFNTEQPSEETKKYVFKQLNKVNWKVDAVLTHTAPLKAEPRHLFIPGLNQFLIDKSTEEFLDEISDKLDFSNWYFGHYHGEWIYRKYKLIFESISEF